MGVLDEAAEVVEDPVEEVDLVEGVEPVVAPSEKTAEAEDPAEEVDAVDDEVDDAVAPLDPVATGSMPADVDDALATGEVAVETDALDNGLLDEASMMKTITPTGQTSLAACVFMAAIFSAGMVAWSFRRSASGTHSTLAPEEPEEPEE